jgi:hypothetical protein
MRVDERRYTPRYNLKIPLKIKPLGASKVPAQSVESANVSARGIYFASALPFQIGASLQISFRMPEEVTGKISPEWNCRGRVVRVDASTQPSGMAGIGVEIQYYEISKPSDRQELNR